MRGVPVEVFVLERDRASVLNNDGTYDYGVPAADGVAPRRVACPCSERCVSRMRMRLLTASLKAYCRESADYIRSTCLDQFFQLTSLSSMIVLQPLLLCEGWGSHPLCLSGYSSVPMDLHWPCGSTAQSSILSIGSVSVALL